MVQRGAEIVMVGRDPVLLETRALLLKRAGCQLLLAKSLDEVNCWLTVGRCDLIVLCHTLPWAECKAMIERMGGRVPMLKLESGSEQSVAGLAVSTYCAEVGPEGLIATVLHLTMQSTHIPVPEKESVMSQFQGTVRWFNNLKGYGFLGRDDGGKDVFTHYSSILSDGYKALKEGQPVTFDIIQGDKGPQADQVRVLKIR